MLMMKIARVWGKNFNLSKLAHKFGFNSMNSNLVVKKEQVFIQSHCWFTRKDRNSPVIADAHNLLTKDPSAQDPLYMTAQQRTNAMTMVYSSFKTCSTIYRWFSILGFSPIVGQPGTLFPSGANQVVLLECHIPQQNPIRIRPLVCALSCGQRKPFFTTKSLRSASPRSGN